MEAQAKVDVVDEEGDVDPISVLFVDDESNILSSLRRLFRPMGYKIHIADGGKKGLEVLEKNHIDLVISDMRMPEMDGAEFLGHVAERYPQVARILLTGYSDMESTIEAINKGRIYRYVSKPWDDNDLRITVQQALEYKLLQRERDRLVELTSKQNEELKNMNANLESMVQARTEEVRQNAMFVEMAYEELQGAYMASIPVFANLIEMGEGSHRGHSRRVGERAKSLAEQMQLEAEQIDDVYVAGLLHDIGKIGLPDSLADTPQSLISPSDRATIEQHPVMGEAALLSIEQFAGAAKLIRHHHERVDGAGFPDAIAGDDIPLGARILSVVSDYDDLIHGMMMDGPVSADEAMRFLRENCDKRYDPAVVDAYLGLLEQLPHDEVKIVEMRLSSEDLTDEMVLSRDLNNRDGMLLLTKGVVLTKSIIGKIRALEKSTDQSFVVYVRNEDK